VKPHGAFRHRPAGDGDQVGVGLDRLDGESERDELARQLARAAADLDDRRACA
jgi:hypothetical protein